MLRWIWTAMLLLACGSAPGRADELETLVGWMTGSFSSAAQAEADPDYFDIRLEMVPIWPDREDGVWMYVEQAAAAALSEPYRQRVYRITQEDATFHSAVFALPDPLSFVGAWRDEQPLARLSPDDLSPRQGCAVILEWFPDGRFSGSTRANECVSTLRGAAYATSEVTVTPEGIHSWDRGFDSAGAQVWGAEGGAYIFDRLD